MGRKTIVAQPPKNPSEHPQVKSNGMALTIATAFALIAILSSIVVFSSVVVDSPLFASNAIRSTSTPTVTLTPTPTFDPAMNAALPNNRIIAFYGIPGAPAGGPAYTVDANMLASLKKQGDAYAAADPTTPVKLGIDLVADVADGFPGPQGLYSHELDPSLINTYVQFCQQNNLLLFLDLQFGRSPAKDEFNAFLPYLQKYSFVHLAIDPEWAFPRYSGLPGYNVGSMDASDINYMITQMALIPNQFHIPRKIFVIHEFRDIVIGHKSLIVTNPLVSIVLHVDSVGNYGGGTVDKIAQYDQWVRQELIQYGGFKLFYNLESPFHLMTPQEVLAMKPAPLVITYGN